MKKFTMAAGPMTLPPDLSAHGPYAKVSPIMGRILIMIILSAAVLAAPPAFSAQLENQGTPARKLQRGFLNIALCPWELVRELSIDKKSEHAVPTWMTGIGKGSVYTVGRALAGFYDLLTFPVPYPGNYEPVVMPEFAWEHFPGPEPEPKSVRRY